MDYKGLNEYSQEQQAFYHNIGVESLWILGALLFIIVCACAGFSKTQEKRHANPVSTDRIFDNWR